MKFDDSTWDKWLDWVQKIESDLMDTINDQAVFHRFRQVCTDNDSWIATNQGHYFCTFVVRCYGARATLGIRRHLKNDSDSVSLTRLLKQIEQCAQQITFDYYLKRFPRIKDSINWQPKTFALLSDDGETVSIATIQSDLDKIRILNLNIENYVDRALAHLDRRGVSSKKVTLKEVEESLDHFNKLACRYICFFTGKGIISLEAVIQFDWESIFSVPLIKPSS